MNVLNKKKSFIHNELSTNSIKIYFRFLQQKQTHSCVSVYNFQGFSIKFSLTCNTTAPSQNTKKYFS